MTEEERKNKITSREFLVDTICGAATALSYSEEDIYATLPKEEADEFIELRKEVLLKMEDEFGKIRGDADAGDETLMAAEDGASYE